MLISLGSGVSTITFDASLDVKFFKDITFNLLLVPVMIYRSSMMDQTPSLEKQALEILSLKDLERLLQSLRMMVQYHYCR